MSLRRSTCVRSRDVWLTPSAFAVNTLVVLGDERLGVSMTKLMATNKTVTVVRVPGNSGVRSAPPSPIAPLADLSALCQAAAPDLSLQSKIRDGQIRSYFHGGPAITQGMLSPFSIKVKFADLLVYRVGECQSCPPPSA